MAGKGSTKDDNQSSGGSRKTSTTTTNTLAKPQEQQVIIKCPRCDSQNTKFCYYNNYSLTQPRHFCKTCRRYWTNGGALRNVPIGGGCRKNKKLKTSSSRLSFDSSTSTRSMSSSHHELQLGGGGGLQFFQGISPPAALVDFQGLNLYNNNHQMNIIPSFGDIHLTNSSASNQNPSCFNLLEPSSALPATSSNIINFPFSSTQENYQTNLASSIESLSSINQDLHWKLQQQRLAMLFGGGGGETCTQKDSDSRGFSSSTSLANQIQKPQPILFHNLEGGSNKEGGNNNNNLCGGDHLNSRKEVGNLATEWFFDPTPTSSNNAGNENVVTGSWNDIQAWTNLNQYTSLP